MCGSRISKLTEAGSPRNLKRDSHFRGEEVPVLEKYQYEGEVGLEVGTSIDDRVKHLRGCIYSNYVESKYSRLFLV